MVNTGQLRTGKQMHREVRSGRRIRQSMQRVASIRKKAEDVGSKEIDGRRKATAQN